MGVSGGPLPSVCTPTPLRSAVAALASFPNIRGQICFLSLDDSHRYLLLDCLDLCPDWCLGWCLVVNKLSDSNAIIVASTVDTKALIFLASLELFGPPDQTHVHLQLCRRCWLLEGIHHTGQLVLILSLEKRWFESSNLITCVGTCNVMACIIEVTSAN